MLARGRARCHDSMDMTVYIRQLMAEVENIKDRFDAALYTHRDAESALAHAAPDCTLVNLPMGTGTGPDRDLRGYLAADVLPHLPADLAVHRRSRTGDRWQVVDEFDLTFTHDRPMPWLLPGREPTHRHLRVRAFSLVQVRRSLITAHRTLWDHRALSAD